MQKFNGNFRVGKISICGASLFIHWSIIPISLLQTIPFAADLVLSALSAILFGLLIFLHECGHAIFAKKLGYQPTEIVLKGFHGYCIYEYFHNSNFAEDEAKIAWGGVFVQFLIAIPLILTASFTNLLDNKFMGPIVVIFGYYSFFMAIVNLLPFVPLDGAKAWKLIGIFWVKRKGILVINNARKENKNIKRIK
jgi:Zn-dependent protease